MVAAAWIDEVLWLLPVQHFFTFARWATYEFPSDPGPFSLGYSILVYPDSILVVSQIFRIRITIHRIHMSLVGYIGYIFGILTRILSGYSIVESNQDTFRIHLEYSIVANVTEIVANVTEK